MFRKLRTSLSFKVGRYDITTDVISIEESAEKIYNAIHLEEI